MNRNEPILQSLAMIEARILEKLTIEKLASDIHFSKHHYQRMFREIVGDSVMHYVTRRKIFLAAKELATTSATILEIALKYGYETHEGFSRSFQAVLGVSPSKYRMYHLSTDFTEKQRGELIMTYSKTEEIIKELNALIVRTKETAVYTRKSKLAIPAADAFYSAFWDSVADRTDTIANDLQTILRRITDITHCPDEISNHFLLMKAMEDTAFHSYILSLQVGLTVSRAQTSHQEAFRPMCDRYRAFAKDAEVKVDKLEIFFNELTMLIFSDMQKNARQLLQKAVEKGKFAASILTSDNKYPYAYIADEITKITDTLSQFRLEEVTLSILEACKFQLDIITFTADIDAMRVPSHKQLFDSILAFQESIKEAAEFFQILPTTLSPVLSESEKSSFSLCALKESYKSRASRINILLFYLKGELQKLGDFHLNTEQRVAFDNICHELDLIIQMTETAADKTAFSHIDTKLRETYDKLTVQAKELGIYGSAIQYLADEIITS